MPDNRVTLDRDGHIVLSYTPNNGEGHKRLIRKLEYLLQHIDGHAHLVPRNLFVGNRIPLAGVAHQNGTIRFGRDPKTSALDVNCKAHEVDNLYVVDGSFFPSSGAVNPALTIMANALRVGDHLRERLGVSDPRSGGGSGMNRHATSLVSRLRSRNRGSAHGLCVERNVGRGGAGRIGLRRSGHGSRFGWHDGVGHEPGSRLLYVRAVVRESVRR